MPQVYGTTTAGGGVKIELKDADGAVLYTYFDVADVSGAYSLGLTANADLDPAGTTYTLTFDDGTTINGVVPDQIAAVAAATGLTAAGGGAAGILSGAGAPTDADGADGGFYVDTAGNRLHGPKSELFTFDGRGGDVGAAGATAMWEAHIVKALKTFTVDRLSFSFQTDPTGTLRYLILARADGTILADTGDVAAVDHGGGIDQWIPLDLLTPFEFVEGTEYDIVTRSSVSLNTTSVGAGNPAIDGTYLNDATSTTNRYRYANAEAGWDDPNGGTAGGATAYGSFRCPTGSSITWDGGSSWDLTPTP